ncbi:MAG: AmmeMemoRadiSam system protein A [Betaproteobacteria bacterium]|nr:AmmeMemoRadiSam system protein A [Betaproteobacteria bacterium]
MSIERGPVLLAIARTAIAKGLGIEAWADESAPWLRDQGASFVTLMLGSELRGCIGSLTPERVLLEDVKENALGAAFRDPRFAPLTREEFPLVRVEVSELSPMESLLFQDEDDARRQLRPHVDGLVLEYNGRRGTFLPQVWDSLPEPSRFLAHLKVKAGLPSTFWGQGIKLSRYTVQKWREAEAISKALS